DVILQDSNVDTVSSFIGIDGTNATVKTGRMQITLKPLSDRGSNAADIIRGLNEQLAGIPDIRVYMQPVQDLTIEDRVSRTQYQMSLSDPDRAVLLEWAPQLEEDMRRLPQLEDVANDQQSGGLQTVLAIDRDAAARLGITM